MKSIANKLDQKCLSLWNWFTGSIFQNTESEFSRSQVWFQRLWIIVVYLTGIVLWTFFLNYGRFNWGVQDWIWEWRYSRILKEALTTGQLPLHTDPGVSYGVTRFLGIPDVPLAPQMLLLRFLDPGMTFLINMLLMYSLSYIGCLMIKRYFRLSVFTFTILALLYNFNGFITAHIGIGHTLFTGYFLLPFFVLLILKLIEGQPSTDWFARMGLVLFGIELVGTTQLFTACLMFLGVIFLLAPSVRNHLLKAILIGVVLSIFRIAPAAISLISISGRPFPGFTTVGDFLASLTWIIPPSQSLVGLPIGWWELDMYVGVIGLVFITIFGIYLTWRPQGDSQISVKHRALAMTMLVFTTFSIGYIYEPINYLPIPLLNLMHVPSRFFLLPLLITIAMASIRLQSWLDQRSSEPWHYFIMVILLTVLSHDLFQHARLWRVEYVFEAFPEKPLDFSLQIVSRVDPLYTSVLAISSIFSLIALVYVLLTIIRSRNKASKQTG